MTTEPFPIDDRFTLKDKRPAVQQLLTNLKRNLPALRELLEACNDDHSEDCIYRFYHGSFKVYRLQERTAKIVALLAKMQPAQALDPYFKQILDQGTGLTFSQEHNKRWLEVTRPIVEAFFSCPLLPRDGGEVRPETG